MRVFGLAGATGTGVVTVSFTVDPDSTTCTAERTSGPSAAVSVSGPSRVGRAVSVTPTASGAGTVVVSVVCSAGGYADATHTVEFIIEAEQTTTSTGCTTQLGALGSQTITQPGAWSADDGCASSQRGNAQTPYYARLYTFSLGEAAEVTIDLSSVRDTFLYVLSGHGASGTRLHYNDDADSSTFDSRLSVELAAGRYTIEATTYSARTAGSFTVTVVTDIEDDPVAAVAATVSGLAASYDATVGEPSSFMFSFEPSAAEPSVQPVSLSMSGGEADAPRRHRICHRHAHAHRRLSSGVRARAARPGRHPHHDS